MEMSADMASKIIDRIPPGDKRVAITSIKPGLSIRFYGRTYLKPCRLYPWYRHRRL